MSRPTVLDLAVLAALVGVASCRSADSRPASADSSTATSAPATPGAFAAAAPAASTPRDSVLVVYKTPTCSCCKGWVERMRSAGFAVEVHDTLDLAPIKRAAGVPADLEACHTARIGGYVIEGHVPAEDIRRLLAERPRVKGIAAPGMPMGSPGMDGDFKDRYDVMTFGGSGKSTVFASH